MAWPDPEPPGQATTPRLLTDCPLLGCVVAWAPSPTSTRRLSLQQRFEQLLAADDRFEVAPGTTPRFGLTCFRLRGASDEQSAALLEAVNCTGKTFLVHTALDGRHVLRMAIGSSAARAQHVEAAWEIIQQEASCLLEASGNGSADGPATANGSAEGRGTALA